VEMVQVGLKIIGIALARIGASAGGQAIAKADEDGAMIRGVGFGLGGGGVEIVRCR
jgi:hypothetical protein